MGEGLRFTIAGYYGFGNLGDEAILASMVADFRQVFPGAVFEIICGDYRPTVSGPDVTTTSWKDWQNVIESVSRCDWLIIGGGGIFTYYLRYLTEDFLRQSDSYSAFIFGLPVLAYLMHKPCFIYGIGAGPLESADALKHARMATRFADVCTVRDRRSRALLWGRVERLRIRKYADPAFRLANESLPAAEMAQAGVLTDEPIVGVVARNWHVEAGTPAWENFVAMVLREFVVRHSIRLLFLPFHAISDLSNHLNYDPAVIGRLRDAIGREHTAELPAGLRPGQVSAVLAGCQVVVSMRLHGAILSVRNATPFVALNYDPKVLNVISDLGLERFVAPVPEDATGAQRFAQLLEQVWTDREKIRETLQPTARRAAEDARGHLARFRRAVTERRTTRRFDKVTTEFVAQIAAEQTRRLAKAEAETRRLATAEESIRTALLELTEVGRQEPALRLAESWKPLGDAANAEREYYIGFCLHMLGREASAALEHYTAALQAGFDEFWVLYHRGQLLFRLGERDQALADMRRAAGLRPENKDAARILTEWSGGTKSVNSKK